MPDIHYSNNNPTALTENLMANVNAVKFLKFTATTINDLGLFREVGPEVTRKQEVNTPRCNIIYKGMAEHRENSNQAVRDMRYAYELEVYVKNTKDEILAQMLLYLAKKTEETFATGSDNNTAIVFTEIDGHYDTIVEAAEMEDRSVGLGANRIFSLGINIVYWVWEAR